ncbi:MAG TPA: methyltransferase domain-containing protein [Pyrinomonadaceae bacterium]|jgi:SAM-dependent methyltransferase|nr:methyltransferase domain-containing protein [Pyrinomonadaceae bacterium]
MSWLEKARKDRGRRALERQLDYQEEKARAFEKTHDDLSRSLFLRSQLIRHRLNAVQPVANDDKVLEVGSGAHGLIFGFGTEFGVGIDPLAVDYRRLFPKWQHNAPTIAAIGERLPFGDASFDIVLSDNVVDHAEDPALIIHELIRVLRPGGLLYFTVNIHHPIYDMASRLHGAWNAVGVKIELSAFADHTVHFTEHQIRNIFSQLPLRIVEQNSTVAKTRAAMRAAQVRNADALLKKAFFKNALYEVVAVRN